MSALKKNQRSFKNIGYMGNFLDRPIQIGDIIYQDDAKHLLVANIEDLVQGFTWDGKTRTGNKVNLKYASESNVNVSFSGNGNVNIAEGEVELSFDSRNSAFVSLNNVTVTEIELDSVRQSLLEIWKSRGFDKPLRKLKYQFINQVIAAESGTVIFSSEKNNKVVLKTKTNEPISSIEAIGSGNIEYVSNSKSTLEIISRSSILPMFQSLRFRHNNQFEIVG